MKLCSDAASRVELPESVGERDGLFFGVSGHREAALAEGVPESEVRGSLEDGAVVGVHGQGLRIAGHQVPGAALRVVRHQEAGRGGLQARAQADGHEDLQGARVSTATEKR